MRCNIVKVISYKTSEMKKKYATPFGWILSIILLLTGVVVSCTNDSSDELEACGCTYYPEIDQFLPQPLNADDVIGEDTYYGGDELRALHEECLERCR